MSDYIFEIDWDNNGDFFGANEDCTADLVSVECRRGRDYASQLTGKVSPGRLAAMMNNPAGKYSSFNAASPLYGNILPGRKIRLRGINPTLGQAVMVEEGTTNQLPLSEDWTSYTGKTAGTAITGDDAAYAPYSALADKIVMDAANNYIYKSKTGLSAITGQTWTFSAKVYVPAPSSVFISINDNLTWAEGWIEKITLVAGWNSIKVTRTFGATVSTAINCTFSNYDASVDGAAGGSGKGAASSGAITFWVLYSQLEQKAYPTSWIDSGVTRAAETLTIPTAGVLNFPEGTIEFWFKPTLAFWNGTYSTLINHMSSVNLNALGIARSPGTSKIIFYACDSLGVWSGGSYNMVMSTTDFIVDTWYYLAITWISSGNMSLYVNGIKEDYDLYDHIPSVDGTTSIGCNPFVSDRSGNSLFDDLRISNIARDGAEILADYNSGQLLRVDQYTTCKIDFDSSLAFTGGVAGSATFTRASVAYKQDGTAVASGEPRYETGSVGQWANIWTGYLGTIVPAGSLDGNPVVSLEANGPLSRVKKSITPPKQTSQLTGTIMGAILDEFGWPAGDRTIDAGQTTVGKWYVDKIDAFESMRQIEETELGFLTEGEDGKIIFEDRHHRLKDAHLVSQQTFTDAIGATIGYSSITQQDPIREIYNDIIATVESYDTALASAVLWTLHEIPTLAPGQSLIYWAEYPNSEYDPSTGAYVDIWDTPVVGTDITQTGVSNSDIGVAVYKFARSMKITITNNNATNSATLTLVQAQGIKITKLSPTSISNSDSASQTLYGTKSYLLPAKWLQTTTTAQDYAGYIIGRYKDPVPVIGISFFANKNASLMVEALTRDISDRITITATGAKTELGIDDEFFIEAISHRISNSGRFHEVMFELSDASGDGGYWILGTAELGINTRLAY